MGLKPGVKTSEFALTLVALVVMGAAYVVESLSDAPDLAVKVVAMVTGILGTLGYGWQRVSAKKHDLQADTAKAALTKSLEQPADPS